MFWCVGYSVRVIHSKIESDVTFTEDTALHGMVAGSATVAPGVTLMLHGMVTKDLILDAGSHCELHGMVTGAVRNNGGELAVFGTVNGSVLTSGGSTEVGHEAVVHGGVHQIQLVGARSRLESIPTESK